MYPHISPSSSSLIVLSWLLFFSVLPVLWSGRSFAETRLLYIFLHIFILTSNLFQYHWSYEGVVWNSEICIMARFECVGVWIDWDAVWIFPSLSSHSLGLILSRVTYVNGHLSKVMCFNFSNVDAYIPSNIHILECAKFFCCLCDTTVWMNISGINNLAHPESIGAFDHVSIHVCWWRF